MNKLCEIEVLISEIEQICPNVEIFQQTSFGEKPFDGGVWTFCNKINSSVYVKIEVQKGMLWAIYASKEFENKYPIEAEKICKFLNS